MKRRSFPTVLATAPCLSSCGGGETPASDSKELRLAFVTNTASDFWTIARKGRREGG
jgi:hypothetical protein